MRKIFSILVFSFTVFTMSAGFVLAQGPGWLDTIGVDDGLIVPKRCLYEANCDLNAVFETIVNIARVLVAFTGAAALLMFMYGGVMFIIAAGNQERVQKGKQAMEAAVIGIIIILGSWIIINFVILALTGQGFGEPAQIFRGYRGEKEFHEAPQGNTENFGAKESTCDGEILSREQCELRPNCSVSSVGGQSISFNDICCVCN